MDTLFFWLSKTLWFFISPLNFILLLLVLVWLLLLANAKRLVKPLMSSIVLLLMFIALFPIGDWLLYPLEIHTETNPVLPEEIEGILVLSGALNARHSALWDQTEVNGAAERELAFMKLARTYPDAALVYTGGSSSLIHQEYKAADVAKKLFQEQGIDTSRIIFERESRNTHENATLSLELVKPKQEKPWILITSAFHMPRSIGIFCKAGWSMIPYPVDHQTKPGQLFRIEYELGGHLNQLNLGIHEWLGLVAYRLTGKTNALLPQECTQ
jgi:uncharacterized SAM-binding protein YcdF (DUF218 family)